MNKHTDGPWKIVTDCLSGVRPCIHNDDGFHIAAVYRGIFGDKFESQFEANARLIAAAPDLLEACERMFRSLGAYLDHTYQDKFLYYAPKEALELGRAAIAKTKGKETEDGME